MTAAAIALGGFLFGAGFAVGCALIQLIFEFALSLLTEWLNKRNKKITIAKVKKIADKIYEESGPIEAKEFLKQCEEQNKQYVSIQQDANSECENIVFSDRVDASINGVMRSRDSVSMFT